VVTDGAILYTTYCANCHGALATSAKTGITLVRLQNAIAGNAGGSMGSIALTGTQQQAIVDVLTPASTTPPPVVTDGATLYSTYCTVCHGALASSTKGGATATSIQSAINNNAGGVMGSLSTLIPTQISAIATALAGVTAQPAACGSCHAIPPATGRHSTHKNQNIACATCHGSGYSTTTVNAATHNNGVKNLTTTIGWNATSRSCSNSCHGTHSW
jgi:mono/diheme cytochrome c family protein